MVKKDGFGNLQWRSLNTLAQNGTGFIWRGAIVLPGKGTDLNNIKTLKGRAKRKVITQTMILRLIDVSDKKNRPERKRAYWNTYHCQSRLLTANGKVFGRFCKNRFCTLCCAIRKAIIINKYLPVLQSWQDPYFVTLTVKSIPANRLEKVLKSLIRAFRRINGKIRKRHQRHGGFKLVGIKSLECNFNPRKKTYNPHLHLIVENIEMAEVLISEWLNLWTSKWTSREAQDMRPVGDRQSRLIELIKYGSKIFTEADVNNKMKTKNKSSINVAALDNIFNAMKGLRIFDRFGFNLPKKNEICSPPVIVADFKSWSFQSKIWDWVNDKDENLTGYVPVQDLIDMLQTNINTTLE